MQKISIDPEVWARTRRKAFDTGSTASKIVEAALADYLDRDEKPRAGVARQHIAVSIPADEFPKSGRVLLKAHNQPIGIVTSVSETPDGITIEGEMPWDEAKAKILSGRAAVVQGGGSVVADAVIPAIEERIRGQDALPPPAVIKDPKEVGAAIAKVALETGREFHPVPKPVRKPRPKRG